MHQTGIDLFIADFNQSEHRSSSLNHRRFHIKA